MKSPVGKVDFLVRSVGGAGRRMVGGAANAAGVAALDWIDRLAASAVDDDQELDVRDDHGDFGSKPAETVE